MLRLATNCVPWIVLVAIFATDARAQVSGANSKVVTWQSPANTNEIFVGVLGEVAKPAVYRLDPQALTLQSVLRRAGGLTEEASRTIRIVRQERVVQSVFYSPHTDGVLLPGDLLVVESRRAQAAVSRTYESDPQIRAVYGAEPPKSSTPDTGVRLAFLNVLDRPVIVKVKHEQANLLNLTQMLDQPIELAQSVKVISPERLLSQAAAQPVQNAITDGSVLVFPPRSINRGKLPTLPPAIESGIAIGAFPSLIGGRSGQSPELRNVGQLPPLMARQPQDLTSTDPLPPMVEHATIPALPSSISPMTVAPNDQRVESLPIPSQIPVVGQRPRIATTVPFSGAPRIKASSATKSIEADPTPEQPPQLQTNSRSGSLDGSSQPNPIDDADADQQPSPDLKSPSSTVNLSSLVGILACVAMLIGVAMATRRFLDRRESAFDPGHAFVTETHSEIKMTRAPNLIESPQPADAVPNMGQSVTEDTAPFTEPIATSPVVVEQKPAAARSLVTRLDQLIRNELRTREERVEFPKQIVLQGRIVPPPVFRVDAAATNPLGHGPHFDTKQLPPETSSSNFELVSDKKVVMDEFDGPHSIRPSKPHFLRQRSERNTVGGAAAATAATISIPTTAQERSLSSTPVTDALRQLQEEHS